MTSAGAAVEAIRKTITVRCSVEHAFHVFTEEIGTWWPLQTHSISVMEDGSGAPKTAVMEPRAGGRLYERTHDGRECDWGSVLVWEPPHRIVLDWRVNPENPATEIEVQFEADGESTRVVLEHRGWERFAPGPGADLRAAYGGGWDTVLVQYTLVAGQSS
jgi:uncharacterized protein YndB with AHSA1/START domain